MPAHPAHDPLRAHSFAHPLSPVEPWLCGQREAHIAPAIEPQTPVLCAPTAACCDNQVRELGAGLPRLQLPEDEAAMADAESDGAQAVLRDGWSFFPRATPGSEG